MRTETSILFKSRCGTMTSRGRRRKQLISYQSSAVGARPTNISYIGASSRRHITHHLTRILILDGTLFCFAFILWQEQRNISTQIQHNRLGVSSSRLQRSLRHTPSPPLCSTFF